MCGCVGEFVRLRVRAHAHARAYFHDDLFSFRPTIHRFSCD